jgi:predicted DNA-binding antitoxin AbrB/MazE fold protein
LKILKEIISLENLRDGTKVKIKRILTKNNNVYNSLKSYIGKIGTVQKIPNDIALVVIFSNIEKRIFFPKELEIVEE